MLSCRVVSLLSRCLSVASAALSPYLVSFHLHLHHLIHAFISIHYEQRASKVKPSSKFVIDCSAPVNDQIFDVTAFVCSHWLDGGKGRLTYLLSRLVSPHLTSSRLLADDRKSTSVTVSR